MTVDAKVIEELGAKAFPGARDPRMHKSRGHEEGANDALSCASGDTLMLVRDHPRGRDAMLAALRVLAGEPDPAVDQAHEAGYAKAIADVRVWLMTDAVDPAFAESDIPYLDGERLCSEFADMLRAGMHRGASDDSEVPDV